MKKSYVVIMSVQEQGAELAYEEPTLEFLRRHLGEVTFQMIRLQPGIELYMDEDARTKALRPRCVVWWKKWPTMPPVPQIIRGPAVFVMRHAKSSQAALTKVMRAVQSEFPVEGEKPDSDQTVH